MAKKKEKNLTLEGLLEQALVSEGEQPYKVPENWVWVRLGSVSNVKGGKRLPKGHVLLEEQTMHPYIRVTDFHNNSIDIENVKFISEDTYKAIRNYTIGSDDIYISIAGTIGKVGIIPESVNNGNLTENAAKITSLQGVQQKYLMYLLNSDDLQQQISASTLATTQAKLALFRIEEFLIVLPPIPEQQRIVDRIESIFEKLDQAKGLIQDALDSFENRKAAILHKAFSGELTRKWREENGVEMESWVEYSLAEVCIINPKRADISAFNDDTIVSFIPMPAVSDVLGIINAPQERKLGDVKKGYTNFIKEDVIFAKITPCMENGKIAVVGDLFNGIGFGSTEFHVLRSGIKVLNRYIYHLLRSQAFRDEAKSVMTGAVGQQRVPRSFLEEYLVNLPSMDEQKMIVQILDDIFGREQNANELYDQVELVDLMKKSILARAFRGELGTNNPDEESALALLQQITQ